MLSLIIEQQSLFLLSKLVGRISRVCSGHPVRVEAIDELVWESAKGLLLDPTKVLKEYETRLSKASSNDEGSEADSNKSQLIELTSEKERVIDLYQSGLNRQK